jgi:hydroxyacylglutathione hydrolase
MLFRRFEAKGLAHFSYLVGDANQALVIDPQRDVDVYVHAAASAGMQITHILETHRNEDYVIGSLELASRTGARVLHSARDELKYTYGGRIDEGESVQVGQIRVEALHTPGHTRGHMSYVLHDPGGAPWMVFSGDALFAGDVGRTDFYGEDRLEEMCGLLYESLFDKILSLGDGVLLCPGHGSGSACGTAIADRQWTSIGLERKLNPMLQVTTKAEFVAKCGRMLEYPPYFRKMEELNLVGPPLLGRVPTPSPLAVAQFEEALPECVVLDTRLELAFGAGHIPGSLSIWKEGVPGWAGWFLPYDRPILLVCDAGDVADIARALVRMGYDRFAGYLRGGMLSWHSAERRSGRIRTMQPQELCELLESQPDLWALDVRGDAEVESLPIPGSHHIHLSQLPEHMDEVPRDQEVYIFCGSGVRAMVAASLLKQAGYDKLTVVLGGIMGWNALACQLEIGG